MHPTVTLPGGLAVPSHPLFVGLGVAVALLVLAVTVRLSDAPAAALARRHDLLAVVGLGLAGGALGMRLSGVVAALTDDSRPASAPALWQSGSKSILGGLTLAYAGVLLGKRLVGMRERTGDLFAPAVAAGMAVGRVGCLLTEPPGRATSLPWAVHLDAAQVARIPDCRSCAPGVGLHPSFAYEIGFHLLALAALIAVAALRRRGRVQAADGAALTWYLLAYATFRFGVEFTRDNGVLVAGLTRPQAYLLLVAALGALVRGGIALRRRPRTSRPTDRPPAAARPVPDPGGLR